MIKAKVIKKRGKYYGWSKNGLCIIKWWNRKVGDKVEITEDDNTKTSGNVIDIAETYITLELEEGGEFDAYFLELKDVRVIK